MTTKFPWALNAATTLIPRYGFKIRIESPEQPVSGQRVDENTTVFDSYEVDAVLTESLLGRTDGYQRADRSRVIIPATENRPPRPGDVMTTPNGRRFIVDTVLTIEPDDVPIMYDVNVSDG